MVNPLRDMVLKVNDIGYRGVRNVLFQRPAQAWHERILGTLAAADASPALSEVAKIVHRWSFRQAQSSVGSVLLPHPFILAAGFVKGSGFETEHDALSAVERGENIIPGWKSMPRLVGLVEFGSFTRHPRMGNAGTVMWRDVDTQSTQNRIGLKNPGVRAAAAFMQKNLIDLPHVFGINIAVSPGVDDAQAIDDVRESFNAFLQRGVVPNWFTLNVSCPNTEDDPSGNQTEALTRALCRSALETIANAGYDVPLWVKLSPDLADSQYTLLMGIFDEVGVRAVVATNTLGRSAPTDPSLQAGIGGGQLYPHALHTAIRLREIAFKSDYAVDVVGCGGVLDGDSYLAYKAHGLDVVQYWSALIYRGPLAAAIIESEYR